MQHKMMMQTHCKYHTGTRIQVLSIWPCSSTVVTPMKNFSSRISTDAFMTVTTSWPTIYHIRYTSGSLCNKRRVDPLLQSPLSVLRVV